RLTDELREPPLAKGGVEAPLVRGLLRRDDADQVLPLRVALHGAHRPTLRRARRRSSSTEWSPLGEIDPRASRASWDDRPSAMRASRTSAIGPVPDSSPRMPSLSLRSRMMRPATFFPTPGAVQSASA